MTRAFATQHDLQRAPQFTCVHIDLLLIYKTFSLVNVNYIDPIMIVTAVMKLRLTPTHTYEKHSQIACARPSRGTRQSEISFALLNALPKCYPARYQFHLKRLNPLTQTSCSRKRVSLYINKDSLFRVINILISLSNNALIIP